MQQTYRTTREVQRTRKQPQVSPNEGKIAESVWGTMRGKLENDGLQRQFYYVGQNASSTFNIICIGKHLQIRSFYPSH